MDLLQELKKYNGNLDSFSLSLPCMLHINDPEDFSLIYLDPRSRAKLNLAHGDTKEAFQSLTMVHPEDLKKAKDSVSHYLQHIDEFSTVSFLQRVKSGNSKYTLLYTTGMMIEDLGGLVSFSVDLGRDLSKEDQLKEIREETVFIQENFEKINRLSKSEIKLMKLWASNSDNQTISKELRISESTIKTYKKRIYKKLEISSFLELYTFASAFDFV